MITLAYWYGFAFALYVWWNLNDDASSVYFLVCFIQAIFWPITLPALILVAIIRKLMR